MYGYISGVTLAWSRFFDISGMCESRCCLYVSTLVYLNSQQAAATYINLYKCLFFCTSAYFSLPAAGLFSCSWLRGTPRARPNTTAQVWALAEVRGTCSGSSKLQVTTGRHSEHVELSRPMQTHVHVLLLGSDQKQVYLVRLGPKTATLYNYVKSAPYEPCHWSKADCTCCWPDEAQAHPCVYSA